MLRSIALLAVLALATAAAAPSRSDEKAVLAAYAALEKALLASDAAALARILAPDFHLRRPNGTLENSAAYVDEAARSPGLNVSSVRLEVTALSVDGASARATVTCTYRGTYAPNGSGRPVRYVAHLTDEWRARGGVWRLQTTAVHDETSYVDGKVVEENREPAPAAPKPADVRAGYARMASAIVRGDRAAFAAVLAPDFQARDTDGAVKSRDAYAKEQAEPTPGVTISAVDYAVTALSSRAATARATVTVTFTGTYSAGGAAKPLRGVWHVTDDWTHAGGAWRLRSTAVHDRVWYVDGKTIEERREQPPPSNAAIAELHRRAVVLPSLALDTPPDAFGGIGAAIGDARIVGMGEGSHGTAEFFAFKTALFKYLVEKKGFTVFAMEANWGTGLAVDRFVKGGRGTAQQAVATLGFWTWDTPEVVDLVQWMHDYNAAPGTHPILTFAGIDMQDPMGAVLFLADYVRERAPERYAGIAPALGCIAGSVAHAAAKPAAGCRERVAAAQEMLDSLGDAPDAALARHAAATILQYVDYTVAARDVGTQTRDEAMAANVEWLAEQHAGEKIAVWAHNGHVGTASELSYRAMGTYLRRAFGAGYYTIGQTFGGGTVRGIASGRGLEAVAVPLNPNDTLVRLFASLNAAAFLDLRGLPPGSALAEFFATQRSVDVIGALLDPSDPPAAMAMNVPQAFDGLVYVPKSTAAASGIDFSNMRRIVRAGGADWVVSGVGFDDVAVRAAASQATMTNADPRNVAFDDLLQRFDAASYRGKTVRVTGEARAGDLLGFYMPEARADGGGAFARAPIVDTANAGAWTPFSMTLSVPPNAQAIDAGVWAEGLGSVEVRDVRIEVAQPAHELRP